jgi:NADH-quinone oxidoreductase subunit F
MIEKMGVEIKTKKRLGKDFTLKTLKDKGYEAVFLGVGAPQGVSLGLSAGGTAKGARGVNAGARGGARGAAKDSGFVMEAIDFLRQYNLTGKAPVGTHVVVVGGGNAAVDAARTALRLGAKTVTVAYRRTQAEMPAYAEEVEEAMREGVKFEFLAAPIDLVQRKGKLSAVKLRRMELGEFDKSGRRKAVAKTTNAGSGSSGDAAAKSEFALEADQVIAAIGQTLKPSELFDGVSLKLNDREFIAINPVTAQASEPWVFAGGDAVKGPSSVVEAIADGEKAAVGINRYLTGEERVSWRVSKTVDTYFDPDADPVLAPRP